MAAIPATCAALFFLRPNRTFWRVAAVVALVIAATGVAALVDYLLPRSRGGNAAIGAWSTLSPLRVLLAPLCAMAFLLAGVFAPIRSCRAVLLVAAAIEVVVFVSVVLLWLRG